MAWQYCTSGTILRDVPYNNDESSKGRSVLDIYLPKPAYRWISDLRKSNSHQQKRPVAIFFVGGAWIVGYKGWGALLARLLAAAGVICFVPDYRNFPQATVSDMVSDTNDAIAWVLANLETYGGDPDNVVLIGQSAGAHLGLTAMLRQARRIQHEHEKEQPEMHPSAPPLPLPESYCRGATWNPKHICSFIGVSGPYNILGMADFFQSKGLYKSVLHMIFENFDEMWSPTDLLDDLDDEALSTIPPMYLFHGTADNTVPHRSSVELAEICESLGLRYACKLLEGHSHTAPIIESPVGGDDPLMADLLHLFSNCVWGQLPSSGGFTGTMTEVFHDPHNDKKMAELSKLVPKANKALLYLARHVNPF
ncbi:putative isoprenylcysteine alpha-carbonyl methylesterase ICME [Diplonema papillatum]|nr:putative isoprenylcysteine alpha-carbonyl methylesterase ICME [Diplonema papillatum]